MTISSHTANCCSTRERQAKCENQSQGGTSAAGGSASTQEQHQNIKRLFGDFKALRQALRSNDAEAAQKAYATLQEDLKNAPAQASGKSPLDPESAAGKQFQALGEALKSGDLTAARKAFNAFHHELEKSSHAHRGHHRHHHEVEGKSETAETSENGSTAQTPSTTTTSISLSITMINISATSVVGSSLNATA